MNIEHISALEYLMAEENARYGTEEPMFREVKKRVLELPRTQERLAFEFLQLSWGSIQRHTSPAKTALLAMCFHPAISKGKISDYLGWIERISVECFELLKTQGHQKDATLKLTVSSALSVLRKMDQNRFQALLGSLSRKTGDPHVDPRHAILNEARDSKQERGERRRLVRERVRHQRIEVERQARTNLN
jgi:hypothetical protein